MSGFEAGVSGNPGPTQHTAPLQSVLCLGRTDLDVLIKRRPVHDAGMTHTLYEVVGMRKEELMGLLVSMDQQVSKKQLACLVKRNRLGC